MCLLDGLLVLVDKGQVRFRADPSQCCVQLGSIVDGKLGLVVRLEAEVAEQGAADAEVVAELRGSPEKATISYV